MIRSQGSRLTSFLVLSASLIVHAAAAQDPSKEEVSLPTAAPDWDARLVLENGETGVWTVAAFPVFEAYASPEVVGLDDLGRCHVLVSYSGKWTPKTRVHDGKWLGGLAHGDVDPRIEGAELYTGGQSGNVYQLVGYRHGALDSRLIAHLPGLEVHTLIAGDLDPRSPGRELFAFTRPGALHRIAPTGTHGSFELELVQELPGRVRDAVLLPAAEGRSARIATVDRAGTLGLLTVTHDGPRWEVVHEAAMGMGRVALRPVEVGAATVLYTTLDDGCIVRHEETSDGWVRELIYAGPQGPRGIVADRFHAQSDLESVAVFGYSGRVELLTRGADGWTVQTIFEDRDRGHWLATAELDGRNATREILGAGYGGRIFMLARPPGFGLEVLPEPRAGAGAGGE